MQVGRLKGYFSTLTKCSRASVTACCSNTCQAQQEIQPGAETGLANHQATALGQRGKAFRQAVLLKEHVAGFVQPRLVGEISHRTNTRECGRPWSSQSSWAWGITGFMAGSATAEAAILADRRDENDLTFRSKPARDANREHAYQTTRSLTSIASGSSHKEFCAQSSPDPLVLITSGREPFMFESAEIDHVIDEETYDTEVPALREALLEAQFELQQQKRFPVIILINGIEGAGKGETVKLLNEWMRPAPDRGSHLRSANRRRTGATTGLALLADAPGQGAHGGLLWQLVQPDAAGAGAWRVQERSTGSRHQWRRAPGEDAVR